MFIHLGNDAVIGTDDIIAVFDMENTTTARQSRDFLAKAQKSGIVRDTCDDLPKSYIIANECGKAVVYISSVSSRTLAKRAKMKNFADTENNQFSMYI